ncbi:hypothetical protein KIH27_01845 [Mycobacterium sp. M1]|uniref:Uncharacterized protein n=1 Tax=Mycolicibacter acidiphilus TaxID=2835306 RepID=A0ABS5RDG6_9MYCO|nr:hypothetical protein [Mycolicibacter acidiphilus]MBS9532327.1 hypothetical protein [Mycolicibacter acidiphilus]
MALAPGYCIERTLGSGQRDRYVFTTFSDSEDDANRQLAARYPSRTTT